MKVGILYETQRQYCWEHGWRPFKMTEGGRTVLGWKNKKYNKECQDLADAYAVTKFNVEISKLWR